MSDSSSITEVISAFLDDELFDPAELAGALAQPGGRATLIDLIALRHVVLAAGPVTGSPASPAVKNRARLWIVGGLAAAGLIASVSGAYLAGARAAGRAAEPAAAGVSSSPAPPPTQVIELKPGVDWHDARGGN